MNSCLTLFHKKPFQAKSSYVGNKVELVKTR